MLKNTFLTSLKKDTLKLLNPLRWEKNAPQRLKEKDRKNFHLQPDGTYVEVLPPNTQERKVQNENRFIKLNGHLYPFGSSSIAYCDYQKKYVIDRGQMVRGVIDVNKAGIFHFGRFEYMPMRHVCFRDSARDGELKFCINKDILIQAGYTPSRTEDAYYRRHNAYTKGESMTFSTLRTTHHADSHNINFRHVLEDWPKNKAKLIAPKTEEERKTLIAATRLLGRHKFGIEYETSHGSILSSTAGCLGMVPLIDGSLNSGQYEFASIPLDGARGLLAVKAQCEALSENCYVDHSCALHVHMSAIAKNVDFLVPMYLLAHRMQEELFQFVPFYKQDEVGIVGKRKNYSGRSPSIPELEELGLKHAEEHSSQKKEEIRRAMYDIIYKHVSAGQENGRETNRKNKAVCWSEKWHCPTRYVAINFVPYFFGENGTVEFRVHEPSLNKTKVINWVLLCSLMMTYAEENRDSIVNHEKISFKIIFKYFLSKYATVPEVQELLKYLHSYVKFRKKLFYSHLLTAISSSVGDRGGNGQRSHMENLRQYLMEDANFIFEYPSSGGSRPYLF